MVALAAAAPASVLIAVPVDAVAKADRSDSAKPRGGTGSRRTGGAGRDLTEQAFELLEVDLPKVAEDTEMVVEGGIPVRQVVQPER